MKRIIFLIALTLCLFSMSAQGLYINYSGKTSEISAKEIDFIVPYDYIENGLYIQYKSGKKVPISSNECDDITAFKDDIVLNISTPTNITTSSASISASISNALVKYEVGFLVSIEQLPTLNHSMKINATYGSSFSSQLADLNEGTTYYVRAFAYLSGAYHFSDPISFTTKEMIRGTCGGYTYIDLGLPSGTLWAEYNVGASSSNLIGSYFAWGETATKKYYSYDTYKYNVGSNGFVFYNKYYDTSWGSYRGDYLTELEYSDDAAYRNWGSCWRMPSNDQMWELYKKCTWTWCTRSGYDGYLVTGPNGSSIFFPTTGSYSGNKLNDMHLGRYWSRTRGGSEYAAYILEFSNSKYSVYSYQGRCYGMAVRPVVNQ